MDTPSAGLRPCIMIGCAAIPRPGAQFCSQHWHEMRPKYNEYKAKTAELSRWIESPEDLSKITDDNRRLMLATKFCYASGLRREFQQFIKPEARDFGHTNFAEQLLASYRRLLDTFAANSDSDEDTMPVVAHEDPAPADTGIVTNKSIRDLRRERRALEAEINRDLKKCTSEREQVTRDVAARVQKLVKLLNESGVAVSCDNCTLMSILHIPTIIRGFEFVLKDGGVECKIRIGRSFWEKKSDMSWLETVVDMIVTYESRATPYDYYCNLKPEIAKNVDAATRMLVKMAGQRDSVFSMTAVADGAIKVSTKPAGTDTYTDLPSIVGAMWIDHMYQPGVPSGTEKWMRIRSTRGRSCR